MLVFVVLLVPKRKDDMAAFRKPSEAARDAPECLVDITKNGTIESARVSAARTILERGHARCAAAAVETAGQWPARTQPWAHQERPTQAAPRAGHDAKKRLPQSSG
jgi:hypothetical protein